VLVVRECSSIGRRAYAFARAPAACDRKGVSVVIPVLETERLVLRGFVPEDLEPLARFYDDPGVLRFLGTFQTGRPRAERTIERSGWMFAMFGFGFWATVAKDSGELVGRAGLLLQIVEGTPEIELAYGFGTPHWGRGYATEAARAIHAYAKDTVKTRRLVSLVHPANDGSAKVATKMGFALEREVVHKGEPARVFAGRI
jgi:RimJ/RimL family protein N-acetyltransferase